MNVSVKACGILLGVLLLGLPQASALAQEPGSTSTGRVRGVVVDSESRKPVGEAEVVLVGTTQRAFSDDAGRFSLEGIAPGTYTVNVTRLGFKPFLRTQVVVSAGASIALDLQLTRTAIPLSEVTVTPGSFSFMGQGTATRQTMSREDVEAVPQIGDDIFRAVNRLPGLASNDYAAHFGIRGGRHDETLILLDGLELYEPYHLKDFNEGAISIIDAETIDAVRLMTGGFPARYGDRRSGVFDITSRTPEPDRTHVDIGSSFLNTRAMARGPLGNGRGSWLAFGRTGYMGLMFQLIDEGDLPRPNYEDAFAKLNLKLSEHQALALEVLAAGDRYTYDVAATTGFQDTINTREAADNHYGNSYVWATLRSTLSPHTTVRTMVSGGLVTQKRSGFERPIGQATPIYDLSNERHYSIFGLVQDWTQSLSEIDILSYGADFRALRNTDTYRTIVYEDPDDPAADPGVYPIVTNTDLKRTGSRFSLYLSNRLRPAPPLVLETGVRYDHASYTGDDDVSPRASAALDVGRGMTLRLGWGYYRQMQGINEVAALNPPARYYPSELSEQWTAGWDWTAGKSVLRVEGYWKRGSHLRPVFRNWKGAVDAFPEPNEDRILVHPKSNLARGVEVYFDRQVGEHLTARASYSYSKATEKVPSIDNVNGPDTLVFDYEHPIPQDQRHAANFDLTYRFSSDWTLNGSFAYHTGWPATLEHLVPVINEDGETELAIRPVKLYAARLPDYLRFDMRVSRKWTTGWGDFGLALEVINLTNHSNVFGYDYFRIRTNSGQIGLDRGDETWFSIMPSLGVTWSRSF
jgi:outer membrane cobalamin receptor